MIIIIQVEKLCKCCYEKATTNMFFFVVLDKISEAYDIKKNSVEEFERKN